MALQHIYTGKSKFTDEEIDEIDLEAPDLIPNRVATILQQSRPDLAGVIPANQSSRPHKVTPRPRRSPVHVAPAGSANYVAAAIEEDQRPRASAQGGKRTFTAGAILNRCYPKTAIQICQSAGTQTGGSKRTVLKLAHVIA